MIKNGFKEPHPSFLADLDKINDHIFSIVSMHDFFIRSIDVLRFFQVFQTGALFSFCLGTFNFIGYHQDG